MDLIEGILDVFESAIYGEAHNSISPIDAETLIGDYRKELEDLFKKQDKISPEKGD